MAEPGLFMNVPRNAQTARPRAASAAVPLFSSPGLQAGVSGPIYFTGRFNGLPWFRLQPTSNPLAQAGLGKPPEGGWESSLASKDPGVNAWAREKPPSFMNNPGEAMP